MQTMSVLPRDGQPDSDTGANQYQLITIWKIFVRVAIAVFTTFRRALLEDTFQLHKSSSN